MLDQASNIIKRQDLDRSLLLFFINSTRKAIVRDTYIPRLNKFIQNIEVIEGWVTVPNLKNPSTVEFELDEFKHRLLRLNTYDDAIILFGDPNAIGAPSHYMMLENKLRIFPMPPEGMINVFGEFFPDDLTDSVISEDVLSIEIPEVLIYLGSAEYFDMLSEPQKADYWRKKGTTMFAQYLKQLRIQETEHVEMLARDPFGNIGLVSTKKRDNLGVIGYPRELTIDDFESTQWGIEVDEVDGGDW